MTSKVTPTAYAKTEYTVTIFPAAQFNASNNATTSAACADGFCVNTPLAFITHSPLYCSATAHAALKFPFFILPTTTIRVKFLYRPPQPTHTHRLSLQIQSSLSLTFSATAPFQRTVSSCPSWPVCGSFLVHL